jgi:hypothetical protein
LVGDVPDFARPAALHQAPGDLGEVVDVDAVEDLARLDDAPRRAGAQFSQRVAAGTVNAGEPQDIDGNASRPPERAPLLLGEQPRPSARRTRQRRRRLVDPGAAAIAVNADAGEIEDAAEVRRGGDCARETRKRRIAAFVGRRRDEQNFGARQRGDKRLLVVRVLERERRDALAPPGARRFGRERRAARLDVAGAGDDAPRCSPDRSRTASPRRLPGSPSPPASTSRDLAKSSRSSPPFASPSRARRRAALGRPI